jgi:hypothetical protein
MYASTLATAPNPLAGFSRRARGVLVLVLLLVLVAAVWRSDVVKQPPLCRNKTGREQ